MFNEILQGIITDQVSNIISWLGKRVAKNNKDVSIEELRKEIKKLADKIDKVNGEYNTVVIAKTVEDVTINIVNSAESFLFKNDNIKLKVADIQQKDEDNAYTKSIDELAQKWNEIIQNNPKFLENIYIQEDNKERQQNEERLRACLKNKV